MKRVLSILTMMSICLSLFAQTEKQEFKVAEYKGVSASAVYAVEITKGDLEKVVIEADKSVMPYVRVNVSRGVLNLSLDDISIPKALKRNMKPIKAYVTVRELNSVTLSGASKATVKSKFVSDRFAVNMSGATSMSGLVLETKELKINLSGASNVSVEGSAGNAAIQSSGASRVDLKLSVEDLKIEGSGASRFRFDGAAVTGNILYSGAVNSIFTGAGADKFKIEVSGASNVDFVGFPVKDMDVKATGVSSINANVTQFLSVDISGGSHVKYQGEPQLKKVEVSSISTLKKVK